MPTGHKFRWLRILGLFLLDLSAAVFVPAIVEGGLWRLLPVHSAAAAITKELCLDLACASFFGFFMYLTWRSWTSKWAWTLSVLWFGFGAISYVTRTSTQSVLSNPESFWVDFSGAGCGGPPMRCRDFFSFTVPMVRTISYSGTAWFASRALRLRSSLFESNLRSRTLPR
jgi:hypothetical protein